jgi:hypothetical protein
MVVVVVVVEWAEGMVMVVVVASSARGLSRRSRSRCHCPPVSDVVLSLVVEIFRFFPVILAVSSSLSLLPQSIIGTGPDY